MFKLLLCTQLSLILVLSGFAQQNPIDAKPQTDQAKIDRYKEKSKNQKIAGWSMLGGGALLVAIGVVMSDGNSDEYYQYDQNGNIIEDESTPASAYFAAAGVLSMVGSIPFFISSGNNKRKARAFVGTTYYPNPISPAHQKIMPSAGIQFNIH